MFSRDEVVHRQNSVGWARHDWWYWEGWLDAIDNKNKWDFKDGGREFQPSYLMGYEDCMGELTNNYIHNYMQGLIDLIQTNVKV